MQQVQPFHLAIPVQDLEKARIFYRETIGCEEGRSSDHWVDFNFFGHQLVIHLKEGSTKKSFFQKSFRPTMFFKDPSGNALEFKAFRDIEQLFAK